MVWLGKQAQRCVYVLFCSLPAYTILPFPKNTVVLMFINNHPESLYQW